MFENLFMTLISGLIPALIQYLVFSFLGTPTT